MFNLKKEGGVVWAGDLASFQEALRIEAMCAEAMKADMGRDAAATAADVPRLYSSANGVGKVTVRGPLINTENFMTAYYGVSTYPAIRDAFVYAANDQSVSQILLDIESGGGAVSGCNETAKLINGVNALKPVTAFTGSMAASAAYWLASGAGEMYADETAIVGSIGVITTHISYAEALKKDGVEVTVLRVGANKALGHPAEKLSAKAEKQIMGQMNTVYDIFTGTIATNTGLDIAKRDTWANGNEFLGADAVTEGLITDVSTYDKVCAQLAAAVDKTNSANNTQSNNKKRVELKTSHKASLSAEQILAIEAGIASAGAVTEAATVAAVAALAVTEAATAAAAVQAAADAAALTAAATPEAKLAAQAVIDAAATAAAAALVETAAAAAALAAATPAVVAVKDSEVVAFLKAELAKANATVLELTVAKQGLDAKIADIGSSHVALCEVVRNSVNKMAIALGGTEGNLANLTATELVAKHAALALDFTKAFKIGGVAATGTEKVVVAEAAKPHFLHLVDAVGISKRATAK